MTVALTVVAVGASLCAGVEGALAFDFFGLFGSDDKPPPVSPTAISYSVAIDVAGGDGGIKSAVNDASTLYRLRKDPPPDGDSLARRASNDFGAILDALWGLGYYNATVAISIDGATSTIVSPNVAALARAADGFRNRAPAPVTIKVDPGPLFRLRDIRVVNGAGEDYPQEALPERAVGLKPGDPAAASALRSAEARIVDYFRNQGRPLAKVLSIAPVVDHTAETMDVTFFAAPGPVAPFGEATLNGPKGFSPTIARSYLYIEPGDPYSPKAIDDARTSLRQIPAVGGVRIVESKTLDAYGRLPYEVDVGDRLPYAVGASAEYSTINGPAGQVYWEDRNVFGGAERLRLEADIFYAPPWYMSSSSIRSLSINDLGGRISASFLKPALWGTRNDFLLDALGEKVSTSGVGFVGYQAEDAGATAALRHRFSEDFWVQAGVQGQTGVATDSLGKVDYTLVGVPVSVNYDTTDSKLDPTEGVRITASAAGYGEFLGSTLNLAQFKARGSTYYAIDPDARFVLAGRIGLGAEDGPALDEIPANWRFYSGGGGSVRGYAYDSLGPRTLFGVVGGRSLFEASAELRVKLTDTIGIVPFFDAGNAFGTVFPNFSAPLYMSAGLGLRYYTAIGPIRLDVAFPFQRVPGSGPVAVYVSIGQAF
jgi:translocation and assembly module TamA